MESNPSKSVTTVSPSADYYQEPVLTGRAVEVPAYEAVPGTSSGETFRFGEWAVGLCGCTLHCVPNCCMACCCPCFSAAQISARLGVLPFKVALAIYFVVVAALYVSCSMVSYKSYDVYYSTSGHYSYSYSYGRYYREDDRDSTAYTVYRVLVFMAEVAAFVLLMQLRAKTRERFEIPGSCCGDCCVSFWCGCCSMAQMATHIKSYKPGSCDFGPPDTLPAYPQREDTPVLGAN